MHAGAFALFPAVELIGGYNTNPGRARPAAGRRALYRRAGIAGAVELVAARTQGRPARQLHRLQPRPDADAEPALLQRQGRRPHRRHAVTRASISPPACWSSTDNPGSPNLQAGLAKLPIFTHLRRQRRHRASIQSLRTVGAKAMSSARSIRTSTADRRHAPPAMTTATTTNIPARCAAAYELDARREAVVEASTDSRVHDLDNRLLRLPARLHRHHRQRSARPSICPPAHRRSRGRLYAAQICRPALRYFERADRQCLADLDRERAHHRQAHRHVGGRANPALPGVSGVLYRATSACRSTTRFRRWLIGIGEVRLRCRQLPRRQRRRDLRLRGYNAGRTSPDRQDLRYQIGFGLTYKLNREVQLKGEVRQDWLRSNVPGNDYTADTFLLGLRFQR